MRKVTLDAYAHQDLPFEKLVEELQPERSTSHTPLFQIVFVLQNARGTVLQENSELTARRVPTESNRVAFDLLVTLEEASEGLFVSTRFKQALFDGSTIARLAGHFENLLAGLVADPERRLSDLPRLTPPERHQLLVEWRDTRTDYPRDRCLRELFEGQSEAAPEVVAVVFGDAWLSYGELNRRANRLGRHLRAQGVGPEVPVGIHLERSSQMVTAMLAILKAGGFYVPLDPSYPRDRVRFMLEDGRIPILVTREELAAKLAIPSVRMLCLDSAAWSNHASDSTEPPLAGATVENLAYLLYTSGSTGRPKGVGCNHAGVINLLADFAARAPLRAGDACSWWTSSSFDVSVYEIFSALVAGATLHVVPDEVRADGERFVAWLGAAGIRSAYVAPSMLQELAARLHREPRDLCLRRLLVGVEPIPEALLAAIAEGIAGVRVINGYGPTEATICATLYRVRAPASSAARNTPIGRPTRNTEIYLLDRDFRPAPIGVAAELSIGGDGLARGYPQRPQLTAARFVPNPFGEQTGGRLYRTGDLTRALPQGDLTFLGRIDHQVKVRGFRIELGEIEAILGRSPQVRECAVLARESRPGDLQLVAYVVAEAGSPEAELGALLKEKLPEYMIPSVFDFLDALPLTPSGKVDRIALGRRALPQHRGPSAGIAAPRDTLELQLTRIWEELLGVQVVDIRSEFFKLGGHSLLAVRLMARIRQQFGRDLPLATLFQHGTVERQAAILRQQPGGMRRRALVAIRAEGTRPPFFCVHPVSGDVLCYGDLARHLGPDQPFYGLQVPEMDGDSDLTEIEEMAQHYLEAVRELQPEGPYRLGGWSMGGLLAYEMAGRLVLQNQRVERVVMIDTSPPPEAGGVAEIDDRTLALLFARDLGGLFGVNLGVSPEELETLHSVEQVLTALFERMQLARMVPSGFEHSQLDPLFERFGGNYRAMHRYSAPSYAGGLVLFKASETPAETPQVPDRGWGELAQRGVEVYEIPGDHYSILQEPGVRTLADRIREVLDPD